MKILVDTNVLVYSAKNGFDLFSELKNFGATNILIPKKVVEELDQLSKNASKGSDKRAAKLAMQIINYSEIKLIEIDSGHTDDAIISYEKAIAIDPSFLKVACRNAVYVHSMNQQIPLMMKFAE